MVVKAAGAKVRAGQAHVRQGRAVRAAANGRFQRLQASLADGGAGIFHQMEMRLDLFQHAEIAVLQLQLHGAFAILFVQQLGNVAHGLLAGGKAFGTVVTHNVAQLGAGHIAFHAAQVVETLAVLSVFGAVVIRQGVVELNGNVLRILHGVLCAARMDREAVYRDKSSGSVKVFIADFARFVAVHRVGIGCAKMLHIKQVSTLANLLIGGKAHADLAVGAVFFLQDLQHGHNLGHTGFVVRTQQGGAIGGDQGLALELCQEWELPGAENCAGTGQDNIAAVIIFMDLGLHILARCIGGSIHMGNKSKALGSFVAGGGGQRGVNIAVLIHMGIRKAKVLQLLDQHAGQVKLAGGGGVGIAYGVRGGIHLNVIQQTFISAHKI